MLRFATRAVCLVFVFSVAAACGSTPVPSDAGDAAVTPVRWPCPGEWVPYRLGGCGPSTVLCAPAGGGDPDACTAANAARQHEVRDADGGVGRSLYVASDGGIAGPWPAPDWSPDAGLSSCAVGWSRLADGTCDPVLRTDCAAGAFALPGGACTATADTDCPAEEYAPLPPEAIGATVSHVRSGADPALADGTPVHPFESIARAMSRASAGAWILVAAGRYSETPRAIADIHIVGVCAARVIITGTAGTPTVSASGVSARLDLRGVTVRDGGDGIRIDSGATLALRRARVTHASGNALWITDLGSSVVAVDVALDDTQATSVLASGRGIRLEQGAHADLSRIAIVGNRDIGLFVDGTGTNLELRDAVIDRTSTRIDGTFGRGVNLQAGARAVIEQTVVSGSAELGVGGISGPVALEMTDSIVRDTRGRSDGSRGIGIVAQTGVQLTLRRVLVADSHFAGIVGLGAGAIVIATDSVVRGTRPQRDAEGGGGIFVQSGGRATLQGVRVEDNRLVGVSVDGLSALSLIDTIISTTLPRRTGGYASGLVAYGGARVTANRVRVANTFGIGMLVFQPDTVAIVDESVVVGTLPTDEGLYGRGVCVQDGARAGFRGTHVTASAEFGVLARGNGTLVSLVESAVTDVAANRDGQLGRGVEAGSGATIGLRRVLVAECHEAGVSAFEPTTRVSLEDSVVAAIRSTRRGFGAGVIAFGGASVDAVRVAVIAASGGALMSSPYEDVVAGRREGARLTASDLFLRDVRTSTIELDPSGMTVSPTGRSVAYALHSSPGCFLSASRVVIDVGGYGFFNASRGAIALRDAVVSRQSDALGATAAPELLVLHNVTGSGNATNNVVQTAALPAAGALPPPSPVCVDATCR